MYGPSFPSPSSQLLKATKHFRCATLKHAPPHVINKDVDSLHRHCFPVEQHIARQRRDAQQPPWELLWAEGGEPEGMV